MAEKQAATNPHGSTVARLPRDFDQVLTITNAAQRFEEASFVAEKVSEAGVALLPNFDHAAIFSDPPHQVAGPLKRIGYVNGWDTRCYPSPVDGEDFINVPAYLPPDSPARQRGWFDYVAVVHPVDAAAQDKMLSQGYGNPFLHHVTWGVVAPPRDAGDDDFAYAARVVPHMVRTRAKIAEAIGDEPGTLIIAMPQAVIQRGEFSVALADWVGDCPPDQILVEAMQGGGFLIQFFVLTGGRIEVALRVDTTQTFNPKSVHKISKDEISTIQHHGAV